MKYFVRVLFNLRCGVNQGTRFALCSLTVVALLTACDGGNLSERPTQPAQAVITTAPQAQVLEPTTTPVPAPEPTTTPVPAPEPTTTPVPTPEPTATLLPTPEPTATLLPTPEPTATPLPTPEPTATPTATPEPTATPTATPQLVAGSEDSDICANFLTKGHSLQAIFTDEDLVRCLSEQLQSGISEPITQVEDAPTPVPGSGKLEECQDLLTREYSLTDLLTNEDLMRCLREELQ